MFSSIDCFQIDVASKTLDEVVEMLKVEGQLILSTRCALPFDIYTDALPPPMKNNNNNNNNDKNSDNENNNNVKSKINNNNNIEHITNIIKKSNRKPSPLTKTKHQGNEVKLHETSPPISPAFSPVIEPNLLFGDYRLNQTTGTVYKQGDEETALPRLTSKVGEEGGGGEGVGIFYVPPKQTINEETKDVVRMREILDECVEIQLTTGSKNEKMEDDREKGEREEVDGNEVVENVKYSRKDLQLPLNNNVVRKLEDVSKDDGNASSSDSDADIQTSPVQHDAPTKYPSDKPSTNYTLENAYTGKLAVSVFTIEGGSGSGSNRSTYYCTLETNNEFKAKTKCKSNDMMIIFDDAFDMDVQRAKALLITLYKQRSVFADKNVAQCCLVLEKVFAEDNSYKKLLVSSTKGNIQILLSIKFTDAKKHLQRKVSTRKSGVFGFNLSKTLAHEKNTIPTLVRKCVAEVEGRGVLVEGVYRMSGDARVKKELRERFEVDSHAVDISDENLVDIHVVTGILKDYLRKLPNPLISEDMYAILNEERDNVSGEPVLQRKMLSKMLKIAPYVNRATLIFIMDHLVLVVKNQDTNRMTGRNVAVCFGPVLMCPPIEKMVDFQEYVDALEFLISIWPTKTKQNMI